MIQSDQRPSGSFDDEQAQRACRAVTYWNHWLAVAYPERHVDDDPPTVPVLQSFIVDHTEVALWPLLGLPVGHDVDALVRQRDVRLEALFNRGELQSANGFSRSTFRLMLYRLAALFDAKWRERSPFQSHCIVGARRALNRADTRDRAPKPTPPVDERSFRELLKTCDSGAMAGLRDAALLWFTYSGCLPTLAEVERVRVEHLRRHDDGSYDFDVVAAGVSARGPRFQPSSSIHGEAAESLHRWLRRVGSDSGPVFCALSKHGKLRHDASNGEPKALSCSSVNAMLAWRSELAGISPGVTGLSLARGSSQNADRLLQGSRWAHAGRQGRPVAIELTKASTPPSTEVVRYIPFIVLVDNFAYPHCISVTISSITFSLSFDRDPRLSIEGHAGMWRMGTATLSFGKLIDLSSTSEFDTRLLPGDAREVFFALFGFREVGASRPSGPRPFAQDFIESEACRMWAAKLPACSEPASEHASILARYRARSIRPEA